MARGRPRSNRQRVAETFRNSAVRPWEVCARSPQKHTAVPFGRGRNPGFPGPPRTDPYVRNYRIRLLPRVFGAEAHTRIRMQCTGFGNP